MIDNYFNSMQLVSLHTTTMTPLLTLLGLLVSSWINLISIYLESTFLAERPYYVTKGFISQFTKTDKSWDESHCHGSGRTKTLI